MKKIFLFFFVLLSFHFTMMAQNISIKGKITDKMKEPIPAVNVVLKSTTNGTVSDFDGNYTITVPVGSTLTFSFVGYKTVSQVIKQGMTELNIILEEDSQLLDNVVVTALGIKRQEKALSYNVQTLKDGELTKVRDANFMNNLNGKVAGVTIQSSSSGIGGATKVVMRGTKSIEGNNNALYVIDGIPMYNSVGNQGGGRYDSKGSTESIADINPDDIESMTVLTGASAAALYGSSASNGAILITTKRGKEGKAELNFTHSSDFGTPFVMPEFQNYYSSNPNDAVSWGEIQSSTGYNPKDFFEVSSTYTNSLTLSLGNEKTQTFASLSTTNAKGLIPNNKYDRYNLNIRNTTYALQNRLRLDIGGQYIIQRDQNMVNQGEYMNPLVSAYLYPRGLNWDDAKYFEQWDEERGNLTSSPFPEGDYTMQNPYWVAYRNLRTSERKRFLISLGAQFTIKEWSKSEKWDIGVRYRIDRTAQEYKDKRYVGTIAILLDGGNKNGFFGLRNSTDTQNYLDILMNFNKNLGEHFTFAGNIGASYVDQQNDGVINQGPLRENGLLNVFNVQNIEQSAQKAEFYQEGWQEQTQSVFGSLELSWKRLLYLTVTGRNDWASQLAYSDNKSFFYPSVGLSGILTDMLPESMRNRINNTLSFAKVRVAYAQVASPFQRGLTIIMNTFNQSDKKWIKEGYYPLKDLKPERTDSYEIGLTTKWFNSVIDFDLTYYRTNTKNQTIRAAMSASSGYNYTYVQTGNVQNEGIELALGSHVNLSKDLIWKSGLTYSYNKNKIKELVKNVQNPQNPDENLFKKDELLKDNFGNAQIILRPGGTLGDVYAKTDFVRDAYGNIDISQDIKPRKEYLKLGSVLPDANIGWRNDFTFNNINLGFLLSARLGGIVISGTQAALDYSGVSKTTADARDNGGVKIADGVIVPAQRYYQLQGRPKDYLTQYYSYDATNIRLREVYVSFNLPKRWFGNVVDLHLTLTGKNLLMIYSQAPFDPESVASTGNYAQGFDYFMMPATRNFGFNISARF